MTPTEQTKQIREIIEKNPEVKQKLVEAYIRHERIYHTLPIMEEDAVWEISKMIWKFGFLATMEFLFPKKSPFKNAIH